jgi:hypothetical protein
MRFLTPSILALLGLPLAATAQTDRPDLTGAWVTPLAPQGSGGATAFLRERLVFEATTNTFLVEAFSDEAATMPLFTYASSGPYRLGVPSPDVPGAFLLDAENDASTVTIFVDAPDLWASLNLGACPLEIGVAVDIASCVSGPPFNAAKCVELDLVSVSEEGLRLGARTTDRCVERPKELNDILYTRP